MTTSFCFFSRIISYAALSSYISKTPTFELSIFIFSIIPSMHCFHLTLILSSLLAIWWKSHQFLLASFFASPLFSFYYSFMRFASIISPPSAPTPPLVALLGSATEKYYSWQASLISPHFSGTAIITWNTSLNRLPDHPIWTRVTASRNGLFLPVQIHCITERGFFNTHLCCVAMLIN